MTRARRLRHRAALTPGTDARHRRQSATRRQRTAPTVPVTSPEQREAAQPPLLPTAGPRFLRPEPSTPLLPPAQLDPPDGTTR
jgi:hypothetical protein